MLVVNELYDLMDNITNIEAWSIWIVTNKGTSQLLFDELLPLSFGFQRIAFVTMFVTFDGYLI